MEPVISRISVKNQITIPKAVASRYSGVKYFEVRDDGEEIHLKPLRINRLDEIRAKLERLGITEQDVTDAIQWARNQP